VPSWLIFDNASGVGRIVSDNVRMAELFLRFKAHHGTVEPLAPNGDTIISTYQRKFGSQRTDKVDVRTTLSRLLRNPGAWRNNLLRTALPELLRSEMNGLARVDLKETLHTMNEIFVRYGVDTALEAMVSTISQKADSG
jgi:hypothetical protein